MVFPAAAGVVLRGGVGGLFRLVRRGGYKAAVQSALDVPVRQPTHPRGDHQALESVGAGEALAQQRRFSGVQPFMPFLSAHPNGRRAQVLGLLRGQLVAEHEQRLRRRCRASEV